MEAALRSGVRPLSFLVPALHTTTNRAYLPIRIKASDAAFRTVTKSTRRCVSSSSHSMQQATAEKVATADHEASPQLSSTTTPTTSSSKSDANASSEKRIAESSKLSELPPREPAGPSSRPSRNSPRQPNRLFARNGAQHSLGGDQTTQILQRLGYNPDKPQPGGFDFSRMAEPAPMPGTSPLTSTPQRMAPAVLNIPPMELSPSTGRTIRVNPARKIDLGRAWNLLNIRLATNQVRADWNYQRFHERPGKKRKRLKMVRWRKRFKASFQATVDRVSEMTRKGW